MRSLIAYEKNADILSEQFILSHLPLVKKIAVYIKRRLPSHIEFDDLLQSGLVGLLEARSHFKPDMGASFETYASIRIRGAIIDALRKNSWVSRDIIKSMKKIADAITKIEQRDKRQATVEDIIAELGVSPEEHCKISQEINMFHVVSFTEEHYVDQALVNDVDDPEKITHHENTKKQLKDVLKTLPEKEQLVLSLYYIEELTFKQIGDVLELTEARICQLHSQAITRVRVKMQRNNQEF